MIILVPSLTTRLTYVFDFVFSETLKVDYKFTEDIGEYNHSKANEKWAYGVSIENNNATLPAHSILFDDDIRHYDISPVDYEGLTIPLRADEKINDIAFDIFASIFYLITRYEEYLPCVKDRHGRYAAYQSVAVQYGFLEKLMVNRYIDWLAKWLLHHFPNIALRLPAPKAIITIDIDHPFYKKNVSFEKFILRNIKSFGEGIKEDKYNTYNWIINNSRGHENLFFILCPSVHAELDGYHNRESSDYKELLKSLAESTSLGIHPSYNAEITKTIQAEIEWLTTQINQKITLSRQHYLKFDIETTYQALLKANIAHDYSMMYSSHIGWRSSTNLPFHFFDVKKNKKTAIIIHSSCIMDSTFFYTKDDSAQDFLDMSAKLIQEVSLYGGEFIPIFHNDILAHEVWKANFTSLIKWVEDAF